ncbi:DUF397 domain-containing protein [Streptomyces prunicolor]|uniref:DUF397 domain-containing protein n=1 Tax=Streptomyces prunicolor TaxID=67348 RepID=UPI0037235416
MPELKWIKSSYSEASANNCVEMATAGSLIALRDSKHPELPWTTVSRAAWSAFTGALGAGPQRGESRQ